MSTTLARRLINFDFTKDATNAGDNYPTELSKIDSALSFARASTKSRFNASGLLETVASGMPALDFNPVTLASRGLRMDGARTNLILNSTLNGAAYFGMGSCSYANITGMDGANTGLALTGTGAAPYFYQTIYYFGSLSTVSVWMKSPSARTVHLTLQQPGIGEKAGIDCNLTTTWQRFQVSGVCSATGMNLQITGGAGWGNGQIIHIWGPQLEVGACASTYIPTTTAAVTRAADTLSLPVGSWYNPVEGTWAIEVEMDTIPGMASTLIGGGTPGHYLPLLAMQSDSNLIITYNDEVNPQINMNPALGSAISPRLVMASSYKSGRAACCANWGAITASTSGYLPPTAPTIVALGNFPSVYDPYSLYGWLRRFVYIPAAVSDLTLQQIFAR